MKTLQINLKLLNYPNEAFSIDKNNDISDDFVLLETLSNADKTVYQNFIDLFGFNNIILNNVELDSEYVVFNRIKLFEYDENYSILNIGNLKRSYQDYDKNEKVIIDNFLNLVTKYSK